MATVTPVCGICVLRHISKLSVVWCPECDEGLCEECKEHHTLSKSSRYHSVIAVSDYQKLPSDIKKFSLICSEHNEQYQMYCKKHESPCCRKCISENHNSCKEICPLEDVISNVKTSSAFQEIEQTLKEVAENHERIMQNRKDNLKSLNDLKIQIEISKVRLKINSHLDRIQDNLIKKLNETEERECKKIHNVLNQLEKQEREIKESQSTMANIKEYASDLQSFLVMKHINKVAIKSNTHIQELVSGECLKEAYLSLNIETALESFTSNVKRFGDVSADFKTTSFDVVQRKNVQAQMVTRSLYIPSIDGIKLILNQTIATTQTSHRGCVALPDGRIVIADNSSTLFVYNKKGSFHFKINIKQGNHFDVTYNPEDNTIAVSSNISTKGQIHIVDMAKRKAINTIPLKSEIYGIVYRNGFFIFCAANKGIQMVNIRDNSVQRLVTNSIGRDSYITSFADYIYYTDSDTHSVRCCDLQGKLRWEFQKANVLPIPLGITVDKEGNVYVVDNKLEVVVVISSDGQRYRQLLSETDDIDLPWPLAYDRFTESLLVGNGSEKVCIYKITNETCIH